MQKNIWLVFRANKIYIPTNKEMEKLIKNFHKQKIFDVNFNIIYLLLTEINSCQ